MIVRRALKKGARRNGVGSPHHLPDCHLTMPFHGTERLGKVTRGGRNGSERDKGKQT